MMLRFPLDYLLVKHLLPVLLYVVVKKCGLLYFGWKLPVYLRLLLLGVFDYLIEIHL